MNIDVIVVLIIAFTVLAYYRYLLQQLAAVRFRVRLTLLQDDLELLLKSGQVPKGNESANFLLYSIDRSYNKYFLLTLFGVICKAFILPKAGNFGASKRYSDGINKFPELKRIEERYANIVMIYLKEQHLVTYYVFLKPMIFCGVSVVKGHKLVSEYLRNAALEQKYPIPA